MDSIKMIFMKKKADNSSDNITQASFDLNNPLLIKKYIGTSNASSVFDMKNTTIDYWQQQYNVYEKDLNYQKTLLLDSFQKLTLADNAKGTFTIDEPMMNNIVLSKNRTTIAMDKIIQYGGNITKPDILVVKIIIAYTYKTDISVYNHILDFNKYVLPTIDPNTIFNMNDTTLDYWKQQVQTYFDGMKLSKEKFFNNIADISIYNYDVDKKILDDVLLAKAKFNYAYDVALKLFKKENSANKIVQEPAKQMSSIDIVKQMSQQKAETSIVASAVSTTPFIVNFIYLLICIILILAIAYGVLYIKKTGMVVF